ncbi:helix-turn-helix domain-containing protein [Deinococcus marmoris]|uniref:helix-turn-helix domain-containing protein n=1 Tax=Deinococcus marmoris TaxID=249408 RepID=UPI001B801080|nr:helix-turn-helix transcriptional regulator [Deinococcus marmoris]
MTMTENGVNWRVGEVLREHGLTAYKLAAELSGKVNRNSVYAIARGDTERVDRSTLAALLDALKTLTGQAYTVADLLEYAPTEEDTEETAAVLADHPDILERMRGLEAGESKLIPWQDVKAELSL